MTDRLPLLVLAAALLAGCGSDSTAADAPEAPADTPAASASFDEAIEDQPCEVLPTALVSETLGVPAEGLEQREIMGRCTYEWDGGEAALMDLDVYDSAEAAQQFFEDAYRTMSTEERDEAEAAMQDELARQQEEGEITEQEAEGAGALGGTIADIAASTEYEPVEGVGDQAVYDGTVRTMEVPQLGEVTTAESSLHVRVGNLIATVRVDLFDPSGDAAAVKAGPPAEVRAENEAKTTALARAMLASMR